MIKVFKTWRMRACKAFAHGPKNIQKPQTLIPKQRTSKSKLQKGSPRAERWRPAGCEACQPRRSRKAARGRTGPLQPAPSGDGLRVDRFGLLDAGDEAIFIGLVRLHRLAGAEDDGWRVAHSGLQLPCVSEVGRAPDGAAVSGHSAHNLRKARDRGVAGIGPNRGGGAHDLERHLARRRPLEARHAPVRIGARHEPHIEAEAGLVRHRVGVNPAMQPADIQRRLAEGRMRIGRKIEGGERQHRAGGLADGVDALLGHGTVRGDALGRAFEPE